MPSRFPSSSRSAETPPVPPRSPATTQSQESLPPSNPSFLFHLFLPRRSDIFLFFAPFCLFLTGLSGLLSNPTAAFSQSAHSRRKNICSFKKSKKTGTPSNTTVSPKSLNLHTFCMHVSAFVSVCFVCGIPDDALSYILLYDCQIQSCSLCNRNADHLSMNFCSITALSIYQNFCSVKIFFYFISLPAPAVPAPVSAPVLLWTY